MCCTNLASKGLSLIFTSNSKQHKHNAISNAIGDVSVNQSNCWFVALLHFSYALCLWVHVIPHVVHTFQHHMWTHVFYEHWDSSHEIQKLWQISFLTPAYMTQSQWHLKLLVQIISLIFEMLPLTKQWHVGAWLDSYMILRQGWLENESHDIL